MKAKLRLADRLFTCDEPECGLVMDRDENAALNLARMADRHAQVEGIPSYVARIGRLTVSTARGGQVSLVYLDEHSPVQREDSPESSPARARAAEPTRSERREALAAA